jgi:hypothetical protein
MKANAIVGIIIGIGLGYLVFGWPQTRASWRPGGPVEYPTLPPFYWPT